MANTINKSILRNQKTPNGFARYAKLGKVIDEYEGKRRYSINLVFGKGSEEEKKMKELCDHYLELAKADPAFNGKKWNPMCNHGYEELEDGTLSFRFRTNAEFKDRTTGKMIQKKIMMFSDSGAVLDPMKTEVGNGSKVQVGYDVGAYYSSSTVHGVNLYLGAVVIRELVTVDNSFGFEFSEPQVDELVSQHTDAEKAQAAQNNMTSNGEDVEPEIDDDPFA